MKLPFDSMRYVYKYKGDCDYCSAQENDGVGCSDAVELDEENFGRVRCVWKNHNRLFPHPEKDTPMNRCDCKNCSIARIEQRVNEYFQKKEVTA
jgi:hypothetical protein